MEVPLLLLFSGKYPKVKVQPLLGQRKVLMLWISGSILWVFAAVVVVASSSASRSVPDSESSDFFFDVDVVAFALFEFEAEGRSRPSQISR